MTPGTTSTTTASTARPGWTSEDVRLGTGPAPDPRDRHGPGYGTLDEEQARLVRAAPEGWRDGWVQSVSGRLTCVEHGGTPGGAGQVGAGQPGAGAHGAVPVGAGEGPEAPRYDRVVLWCRWDLRERLRAGDPVAVHEAGQVLFVGPAGDARAQWYVGRDDGRTVSVSVEIPSAHGGRRGSGASTHGSRAG